MRKASVTALTLCLLTTLTACGLGAENIGNGNRAETAAEEQVDPFAGNSTASSSASPSASSSASPSPSSSASPSSTSSQDSETLEKTLPVINQFFSGMYEEGEAASTNRDTYLQTIVTAIPSDFTIDDTTTVEDVTNQMGNASAQALIDQMREELPYLAAVDSGTMSPQDQVAFFIRLSTVSVNLNEDTSTYKDFRASSGDTTVKKSDDTHVVVSGLISDVWIDGVFAGVTGADSSQYHLVKVDGQWKIDAAGMHKYIIDDSDTSSGTPWVQA